MIVQATERLVFSGLLIDWIRELSTGLIRSRSGSDSQLEAGSRTLVAARLEFDFQFEQRTTSMTEEQGAVSIRRAPFPSAMLLGIDTDALRIWLVRP